MFESSSSSSVTYVDEDTETTTITVDDARMVFTRAHGGNEMVEQHNVPAAEDVREEDELSALIVYKHKTKRNESKIYANALTARTHLPLILPARVRNLTAFSQSSIVG